MAGSIGVIGCKLTMLVVLVILVVVVVAARTCTREREGEGERRGVGGGSPVSTGVESVEVSSLSPHLPSHTSRGDKRCAEEKCVVVCPCRENKECVVGEQRERERGSSRCAEKC